MSVTITFKTGLILSCNKAFNPKDWSTYPSLLIRLGTKSKWSHTAMTVEIWGQRFVIDSDAGKGRLGVAPTPWTEWVRTKKDVHVFDPGRLTEAKQKDLALKALSRSGWTSYDFLNFKAQTQKVITGKWKGDNNLNSADDKFICSEFVAWLFQINDWHKVTPADLYKDRYLNFPEGATVFEGNGREIVWK